MPIGSATPRPERPARHRLAEVAGYLAPEQDVPGGSEDVIVTGVAQDSRMVRPGDLYVARSGAHAHGAAYAQQAEKAGAVAALTDPAGQAPCEASGLPTLVVADPAAVLGRLSAFVYGEPANDLTLLGVTGTNGKTTTTYLLDAALAYAGHRTGLVGTIETRIAGAALPSARSTPEAPDLQALLAVMREREVAAAVLEVSSHALALGRVDGTVFDVAGFTYLGQDHLEWHGDQESYFRAKAALFTPDRARLGVVDVDGPYGARLADTAPIPIVTVSPSGRVAADWRGGNARLTKRGGTAFDLAGPRGTVVGVELGMPGAFNVANACLALAMLDTVGLEPKAVVAALAWATVPGRMERFESRFGVVGIVDYAHTPDAIAGALRAARPGTTGRLIAVVGCGGDRDQAKRPLMGQAAATAADLVVITDDNPRSEDPARIRAAALAGAEQVPEAERAEVVEVGDRREAIRQAFARARPGDLVLVLGKGHEQGQEIAGVVHPFDDRAVVREILERREERGTSWGRPQTPKGLGTQRRDDPPSDGEAERGAARP